MSCIRLWRRATTDSASKRRRRWTVYCGARCARDDDGCSSNGQQARDRSRKSEPVLGRGARQPRHRDADTRPAAYRGGRSACSRPGLPTFPSLVHSRKRSLLRRRRRCSRRASSRFTTLPATSLPLDGQQLLLRREILDDTYATTDDSSTEEFMKICTRRSILYWNGCINSPPLLLF